MKLDYKRTIYIGMAFLGISAFWQLYDVIIPLILENQFALDKTWTGLVMSLDNILSLLAIRVPVGKSDQPDYTAAFLAGVGSLGSSGTCALDCRVQVMADLYYRIIAEQDVYEGLFIVESYFRKHRPAYIRNNIQVHPLLSSRRGCFLYICLTN